MVFKVQSGSQKVQVSAIKTGFNIRRNFLVVRSLLSVASRNDDLFIIEGATLKGDSTARRVP